MESADDVPIRPYFFRDYSPMDISLLGTMDCLVTEDFVVLCFRVSWRAWSWNIFKYGFMDNLCGVLFRKDDVSAIESFKAKHGRRFHSYRVFRGGETLPWGHYIERNALQAYMKWRGVRI